MASGGLKGALVTRAVNAKIENWRKTGSVTHKVYDALVFRKVSLARFLSTGGLTNNAADPGTAWWPNRVHLVWRCALVWGSA